MLGKILLCLSVAAIGFIYKNNALYKTEALGTIDFLLKQANYNLEEAWKTKIYNILCMLAITSGLGWVYTFEFAAVFGGIALGVLNYLKNFDVNNPLS